MKNDAIRRIQELCSERSISTYKLAKLSGIPKNTMNNMIAEDRIPTLPTLEKICSGLNITLAQFFTSKDIYPELTEDQEQFMLLWESLSPGNQDMALKYLELMKEHQEHDK